MASNLLFNFNKVTMKTKNNVPFNKISVRMIQLALFIMSLSLADIMGVTNTACSAVICFSLLGILVYTQYLYEKKGA